MPADNKISIKIGSIYGSKTKPKTKPGYVKLPKKNSASAKSKCGKVCGKAR